jgi:1,4-dihydroxy-2-naphthoyl-CoA hydrolase
VGETAFAETIALHKGRTTMVWRTDIKRADGKLCAVVTQTQMVLMPNT